MPSLLTVCGRIAEPGCVETAAAVIQSTAEGAAAVKFISQHAKKSPVCSLSVPERLSMHKERHHVIASASGSFVQEPAGIRCIRDETRHVKSPIIAPPTTHGSAVAMVRALLRNRTSQTTQLVHLSPLKRDSLPPRSDATAAEDPILI